MTTHVRQTLPFPWQGGRQCSLQPFIQPWICARGTQYGWVDRGIVEYEACLTVVWMTSTRNRTPDLLIKPNALSTWLRAPISSSPEIHSSMFSTEF